ncbi:putative Transmembrane protein [Glarea lozoyensis 74030]|uniref:Putative Transmembrane protein n=1 Tax=Glarea lozoyensis (strain ATCC 74030 / MF5533) TaxID=1104152 RepID=H0EX33_GLAL7|nr:putative Transmembrane protein [Glarea lozoyensis 74030]
MCVLGSGDAVSSGHQFTRLLGLDRRCPVFRTPGLHSHGTPIVIGSLGAAAILEYQVIDSPLSQPRNAILGQLFSTIIGVGITKLFQHSQNFEDIRWIAGALAVGLSSVVMGVTKTVHPPAGATALLAATSPDITDLGWFLIPLVLIGSTLMVASACVVNNIQRQFPVYWWTAASLRKPSESDIEKVGPESGVSDVYEDYFELLKTQNYTPDIMEPLERMVNGVEWCTQLNQAQLNSTKLSSTQLI